MKLLIGYDGSRHAEAALEDLQWAGLPPDAEAIVLSAADVWLPPQPEKGQGKVSPLAGRLAPAIERSRAAAQKKVEEALARAEQASERLRTLFPGWKVQAEAYADSPAWALIKRAETWKPDLIVVGSQGLSDLGGLLLGSVSQKVLAEAQCSVRVARPRRRNAPNVRIIIGVDGSPDSNAAAQAVAHRSWPQDSEVCLVAALDPMMETAALPLLTDFANENEPEDDEDLPETRLRACIESVTEKLRVAGLTVTPLVTEGDPRHVLLEQAEQWEADCLFVGACGLRGVSRFLLGSVSAALAARAACSVEVTRVGKTV